VRQVDLRGAKRKTRLLRKEATVPYQTKEDEREGRGKG
jgi:hypothetical protein